MTSWRIVDAEAARDLRIDTDLDARQRVKETMPAAPDFTRLRGPTNSFIRKLAGRNN